MPMDTAADAGTGLTRADRAWRALLIAAALWGSWLLMMVFHELSHATFGWLSGARVTAMMLGPHIISQTILDPNPHPLLVAWGGPLLGSGLPLALWGLLAALRSKRAYLGRFLAAFCLVANGAYIGVGALTLAGDAGDMYLYDCPRWVMGLFGLVASATGFWLWHRQGRFFGVGPDARPVSRADALGVLVLALAVAGTELAFFS